MVIKENEQESVVHGEPLTRKKAKSDRGCSGTLLNLQKRELVGAVELSGGTEEFGSPHWDLRFVNLVLLNSNGNSDVADE